MPDSHPLVCRFGAFGDMVMLTPMLKRLYQRCGKPVDVVGIGDWTVTMFEHLPYVRQVFTITSRATPYFLCRSQQRLARELRSHDYQYAWIAETHPKSYRIMAAGGINVHQSINAKDYPAQPDEHFVAQWLRLANQSPPGFDYPTIEDATLNTELFVSDEEKAACRLWLQTRDIDPDAPLVCIQAGNKRTTRIGRTNRASNTKYWPEQNWANVIDHITDQLPGAQVLLCGVPAEYSLTQTIRKLCNRPHQVFCVADDLPLRRLLAVLSMAHSCISVDTGPAHAAAALNCPLTVLFGKANPGRYRPVSRDSRIEVLTGTTPGYTSCQAKESWQICHDIRFIKVETVVSGWEKSIT